MTVNLRTWNARDETVVGYSKVNIDSLVQGQTLTYYADTGAADAYVITPDPPIAAYAAGQAFEVNIAHTNTGASTLNVSGKGAVAIKKQHDVALTAGDLEVGQVARFVHDGTNFQMESQLASVLPIGGGGTGQTTAQAAIDALLSPGTVGYVAQNVGGHVVMAAAPASSSGGGIGEYYLIGGL